jgi:hypothetical protein
MTVAVPSLSGIAQGAIVSATVTTQGGTSSANLASRFEYYLVPTVNNQVGPLSGFVNIIGTNFVAPMTATFDGVVYPVTLGGSNTEGYVELAKHAAGEVSLIVYTLGGTSNSATYTYTNPTISNWPESGAVGNTVYFDGSYFSGDISVTIGGSPATVIFKRETRFEAEVPAGTNAQTITVIIDGVTLTSPGLFYYPPTVNNQVGPLGGPVTITGTNFVAPMTASFGSTVYDAVVNSASSATVTLSNHAAGEVSLIVYTLGGTSNSATYTYTA